MFETREAHGRFSLLYTASETRRQSTCKKIICRDRGEIQEAPS